MRFAVASALVGALALAGCQSPEEPPSAASPTLSATSASPSPTATPSPSASEADGVPAAAREKTEEGAEAFVRHFMVEASKAWTVPDPALIERHATDKCGACADLASVARDLEADGHRYDTDPISLEELTLLRESSDGYAFDAQLLENEVDVVTLSGTVVESFPERAITRAIAVKWEEGRWRLDGIGE
ncbi:DUF6318 family protein [Fodinibacter luteus]|uniref:DUF6318 family protein n=1 Tax=Fodinibacter luteus TaxID=552064 RepID=UPI0031EDB166